MGAQKESITSRHCATIAPTPPIVPRQTAYVSAGGGACLRGRGKNSFILSK